MAGLIQQLLGARWVVCKARPVVIECPMMYGQQALRRLGVAALSLGVISNVLFSALVLMAVVTTLMAGPLLKLIDGSPYFEASNAFSR